MIKLTPLTDIKIVVPDSEKTRVNPEYIVAMEHDVHYGQPYTLVCMVSGDHIRVEESMVEVEKMIDDKELELVKAGFGL